MIPGEYFCDGPLLELNAGRSCSTLEVNNTGDRPIQVGSHFHFFEANRALKFDRPAAYGMRLDIPAGTAVRFEPGEIKSIQLIPLGGLRQVYGGSGLVMGSLDVPNVRQQSLERLDDFLKGNYLPSALLSRRKADKASKPNKPAKKSKR